MNIIYHHRTQGRGAEGVHIREVVKALRNAGHAVFVASPPGVDPVGNESSAGPERQMSLVSSALSWLSRYIPQFGFELMEMAYNLAAYRKIGGILEKEKIAFIYERYAFFCCAAAYLKKRKKVPLILEVNEISGIKRARGQSFRRLAKSAEKWIFRNADAIIVVSPFLKEQISAMGIESAKIHVLPNAVNDKEFDVSVENKCFSAEHNLAGKVVLGFVGSFIKWHNFGFLLNAFNELRGTATADMALMLVGDGPLRGEVEKQVKAMGISGSVIFTGAVPHKTIPSVIKSMDICIIPQSNDFRSPIKMFEYMAMAKPVVAPGTGPIKDVITDQVTGVLFEAGNKEMFVRTLKALVTDAHGRAVIGGNARKEIMEKYLWKHNAVKVLEIYGNIINA